MTTQGFAAALRARLPGMDRSNYPYVTARVKGKKKNLLTADVYPKLMKMGPSEIARLLSEAAYHREMTELASKYSGTELVERALNLNLARTYREVLGYSKGDLHRTLEAYLDWWNVYNIKIILRGLHHGIPDQEIREHLVPAGSFSIEFLESLLELDTVEDSVRALAAHGYRVPPEKDIQHLRDANHGLRTIEDFYDRTYYQALIESARGRSKPSRIYMSFVRRTIDVVNAKNLMEMMQDGVQASSIRDYMLPGGEALTVDALCGLAAMKPSEALDGIRKAFGTDLGGVDASSANMVAIQLDRYVMGLSDHLSNIYPLSIIPVVDFLLRKEKETTFLRIIVKGKENALPEDRIRRLLPV